MNSNKNLKLPNQRKKKKKKKKVYWLINLVGIFILLFLLLFGLFWILNGFASNPQCRDELRQNVYPFVDLNIVQIMSIYTGQKLKKLNH